MLPLGRFHTVRLMCRRLSRFPYLQRHVQRVAGTQNDGPRQKVFQFADVARPIVRHHLTQHVFGDPLHMPAELPRQTPHKMRGQQRDVIAALAQWRHVHRHHQQPVVQVHAKPSFAHQFRQVAVRGRKQTHVHLQRAIRSHRLELLLLQHSQ